jgi:hypothetical protein
MVGRRRFLFGAGAAILAAPTLSTLRFPDVSDLSPFNFIPDPQAGGAKVYPIDRTLDRLLEQARGGNRFVAMARTEADVIDIDPVRILPAPRALRSIFNSLNIGWDFEDHVCYCVAKQCEQQFRQHEQVLRERFNAFAGVKRSPVEENVAYMVGADSTSEPTTAAAATQYGGYRSQALSGKDPGLLRAASDIINDNYELEPEEAARTLAVADIRPYVQDRVRVGTRYETPNLTFIHRWEQGEDAPEALQVFNKLQRDNKVYTAEIYA